MPKRLTVTLRLSYDVPSDMEHEEYVLDCYDDWRNCPNLAMEAITPIDEVTNPSNFRMEAVDIQVGDFFEEVI